MALEFLQRFDDFAHTLRVIPRGDQQPDAAKKYTYTAQQFYRADSPLLPSGLLGPVQIVQLTTK